MHSHGISCTSLKSLTGNESWWFTAGQPRQHRNLLKRKKVSASIQKPNHACLGKPAWEIRRQHSERKFLNTNTSIRPAWKKKKNNQTRFQATIFSSNWKLISFLYLGNDLQLLYFFILTSKLVKGLYPEHVHVTNRAKEAEKLWLKLLFIRYFSLHNFLE